MILILYKPIQQPRMNSKELKQTSTYIQTLYSKLKHSSIQRYFNFSLKNIIRHLIECLK